MKENPFRCLQIIGEKRSDLGSYQAGEESTSALKLKNLCSLHSRGLRAAGAALFSSLSRFHGGRHSSVLFTLAVSRRPAQLSSLHSHGLAPLRFQFLVFQLNHLVVAAVSQLHPFNMVFFPV
ncbi:unnamed protein product [Cuscuta europaea]|uniref:Uncharacterized protein n=1 Tax=Cuscuta europaea TaxID=41803 RepID=A0A9P0YPB8_CUSEU|nr:unnamed protein product [Cuscuta europaea]